MKSTIGIIGCGVVGGAVKEFFTLRGYPVLVYDKFKEIGSYEKVTDADLIFVSVPTPTDMGTQDLTALDEVLGSLSHLNYKKPVVIKSTVLPGTCDELQRHYAYLNLVHNPEFLTEKAAYLDFAQQRSVAISGIKTDALFQVYTFYCRAFPDRDVLNYSDFKVTEMGKYIHNTFLATKVAFMNEIYTLCESLGISYEDAVKVAKQQGVIGANHTKVPGPDGKFGFGGMCFVKDTEALLNMNDESSSILTILDAAVRSNKTIRPSAYDGSENVGNT